MPRPKPKPPFIPTEFTPEIYQFVNVIVNQVTRLDDLVTSVVPGSLAAPLHPADNSYQLAQVTKSAPNLSISQQSHKILFDSGALTKHSVLSKQCYDKMCRKGIQLVELDLPTPTLTPVVGVDFAVHKTVLLALSVIDCDHLHHTGDIVAYVVDMNSFDLIVNNAHSKIIFNRYFYESRNWLVISNPFRDGRQEESLILEDLDIYGVEGEKLAFLEELFPITDEGEIVNPHSELLATDLDTRYASVFMATGFGIKDFTVSITTSSALPAEMKSAPRKVRRDIATKVSATLQEYTAAGLHVPTNSVYSSPLVPVVKPDGSIRLAVDYSIGINKFVTSPSAPIPLIRNIISALSEFSYFAEFDLAKAYRQLVLSRESSELLSYVTQDGQFRPLTLPEGVKSAPHVFMDVMYQIFRHKHKLPEWCQIYFDNLYVGAASEAALEQRVRTILDICLQENIKLKRSKCVWSTRQLKVLGFIVEAGSISVDPARITALVELPVPTDKSSLRSVLGSFILYSHFIINYATIIAPLYDLLRDSVPFIWLQEHQDAFEQVRSSLPYYTLFR